MTFPRPLHQSPAGWIEGRFLQEKEQSLVSAENGDRTECHPENVLDRLNPCLQEDLSFDHKIPPRQVDPSRSQVKDRRLCQKSNFVRGAGSSGIDRHFGIPEVTEDVFGSASTGTKPRQGPSVLPRNMARFEGGQEEISRSRTAVRSAGASPLKAMKGFVIHGSVLSGQGDEDRSAS
jgi:hypothetical protein